MVFVQMAVPMGMVWGRLERWAEMLSTSSETQCELSALYLVTITLQPEG